MNILSKNAEIKVDVNLVLRGTVYPPVLQSSCDLIRTRYDTRLKINTLSFEDVYGGKFCAALDRQHPRDLFDVMIFFQKHQVTSMLKKSFMTYLISGNRPISELINPNRLNQRHLFEKQFKDMADQIVSYGELESAREHLISALDQALTTQDRDFLLSVKKGEPQWELLDIECVKDLPAIKWKLHNMGTMTEAKKRAAYNELKRNLEM